jgi:SAM-dependent methyltransferase
MPTMDKPFSEACARNRGPILQVLRVELAGARQVLEIGSRTGQHAVHFAAALPHLRWQCSDLAEHLAGMQLWLDEADLPNLPAPIVLDVDGPWPRSRFDAVFTANTLHILRWVQVQRLFDGVGQVLRPEGCLVAYGPFNVDGRHTSAGNAQFDATLRAEDAQRGLRDIGALDALARDVGLLRGADHTMPANNRCLVWRRPATDDAPQAARAVR